MSEAYSVNIVKFIGGFTDINQLNIDLENNTSSDFMAPLIESATDQGISPLKLFGPSHYIPSNMGLISQDEGSINCSYYESANYYYMFDDSDCDIIASYIKPDSKLVISFCYDTEQQFFIFEHNTWKSIAVADLF